MSRNQAALATEQAAASAPSAPRPAPAARDYALFEADMSGRSLDLKLLRRMLHWMAPYRRLFAASAVLMLITSTLQVLLPVILSLVVIDHLLNGVASGPAPDLGMVQLNDWLAATLGWHPLIVACAVYTTVQIAWALTGHAHRLTLARGVTASLRDLRLDLFKHLETRPASFYDRVAVGRVMTRVTNDIEALYELVRGMSTLVGEFVPFFVALAIMLTIDVQLTLILLLAMPLMAVVTYYFRRTTRKLFRQVRQALSSLNQYLQENLAGLAVVQLSGREEHNLEHYGAINQRHLGFELRSARLETLYGAFNDSMAHVALGAILWFGGGSVVQGAMSLGSVILFTRFVDMLLHPIVAIGEQTNVLFRAMASLERIFQALDWDEQIHEPVYPVALPPRLQGELRFEHLSFEYLPGQPVLKDLSLTIRPGETLAIVGPTGSGKSTLIRLLGRFYDIEPGSIFLDGIDLTRIASRDVRQRIGVVLQDFHIFSGTIYDNIALGQPSIDRAAAEAAARQVNAHEFILAQPNGYDTQLSERGQNLSQGQRQLLAFARVLAADPEILILDEATASIDTSTELLIQAALRELTRGRTSILIAHRLQTIQDADRILVLKDGEVAELGTHDELIARKGVYATLHELQFQD